MVIVFQAHRRTTSLAPLEKVVLDKLQIQVSLPLTFGSCTDGVNDYNCTCVPGFVGKNCSNSRSLKIRSLTGLIFSD